MTLPEDRLTMWRGQIPVAFRQQLIDGYKEAFCSPPRLESWTDEEAWIYMKSHLEQGGRAIAALQGGELKAVEFSMPLEAWRDKTLFSNHADIPRSFYLGVIYVRTSYRGEGLGLELVQAEIAYSRQEGKKSICARTRKDTPEIISLFLKCGFAQTGSVYGMIGGVEAEHLLFCKTI